MMTSPLVQTPLPLRSGVRTDRLRTSKSLVASQILTVDLRPPVQPLTLHRELKEDQRRELQGLPDQKAADELG